MADRVLVIGEALIDVVEREGRVPEEHVGGSPANVALGLGRLGVAVRLRTAIARDERGRRIHDHLAASGVEVEPESFVLDRTSSAVARISREGDARYEFDIEWRIGEPLELGDAHVVHVGSIGCFVEPGATSVFDALRAWGGRVRLTFDPNIRPSLIGDRDAAIRTTEEIASASDLVKLSREDAEWLYPDAGLDDILDHFLATGSRVVAVTLGGEGALIASDTARVRVAHPVERLEDSVGAGDTFMAAMVATVADSGVGPDAEALTTVGRRAAAAAAITVSRAGADLPTREEVERELARRPSED
ncbi:MAG: PfkB family carbohydrate kinase [Pseudolysinimonas sp.]|uniref:PfkB family carbohydrate kinase n=1 Tax=Pseudolysinimonas sp. TaxID=2680009 RepID=UPI003C75CE86